MSNTANIAVFALSDVPDVSDVSAASGTATAYLLLRNRYSSDASVFTAVVAATESTAAKIMFNTANIAGLAISDVSDVSDASSNATPFSLLGNRYCSCCQSLHCSRLCN